MKACESLAPAEFHRKRSKAMSPKNNVCVFSLQNLLKFPLKFECLDCARSLSVVNDLEANNVVLKIQKKKEKKIKQTSDI